MKIGKNFNQITEKKEKTILTGIKTFDDWFSTPSGMVIGSSIFLTGSSGAGKTSLAVYLMEQLNEITLLYSREMKSWAVREQTSRFNLKNPKAFIADSDDFKNFEELYIALETTEEKPKVLFIDSLQVIAKEDFPHLGEEQACFYIIQKLRSWIEKNNCVLFLIGHVTKENEFRGANTILQMMDAHMEMIYDKKTGTRTISWGQKNRKGILGTIYYQLNQDGIEFLTKEEWEIMGEQDIEQQTFDKLLENAIVLFYKQHKNKLDSKERKEYIREMEKIENSNLSFQEMILKQIYLTQKTFK